MRLEALKLFNYKGFELAPIVFEQDVTVLVGPNDTGKSNLLGAIAMLGGFGGRKEPDIRSKDATAAERVSLVSYWAVPTSTEVGKHIAKHIRAFTVWSEVPPRVSLETTSDLYQIRAEGLERRLLQQGQVSKVFPGSFALDLSNSHESSSMPGTIASVKSLTETPNVVLHDLLRANGCDIDTLLQSRESEQRRMLQTAAAKFNQRLKALLDSPPSLELYLGQDGVLHVDFQDTEYRLFAPTERGHGLLCLLGIIARLGQLVEAEKGKLKSLILLDEPETGLHPGAQEKLRDFLAGIAREEGHQVIYATHSPFMIDPNHIRQVRLVSKEGVTCFVENKPYHRIQEQPIQTALQLPLGYSLFLGEQNVIVEGICDQMILVALSQACAAHGLPHLDLRKTSVIPAGGGGENIFADLRVRASKSGGRCIAVYDKDERGFTELKRAREAECQGLYANGEQLNPQEKITERRFTVEDLVPQVAYLKAFKENFAFFLSKPSLNALASAPADVARVFAPLQELLGVPILSVCEDFAKSDLAAFGYGFRKADIAREVGLVILEDWASSDQAGDSSSGQDQLQLAVKLFKKLNEAFEKPAAATAPATA